MLLRSEVLFSRASTVDSLRVDSSLHDNLSELQPRCVAVPYFRLRTILVWLTFAKILNLVHVNILVRKFLRRAQVHLQVDVRVLALEFSGQTLNISFTCSRYTMIRVNVT